MFPKHWKVVQLWPVLLHGRFLYHTDDSKRGVGAMLAQQINQALKPIQFALRVFSEIESCWHTMEMELFAVKWALEQFSPYVLGIKTKIGTDHANLQWLISVKPHQSKLADWCSSMSKFDFYIVHKTGKKHAVLDTHSLLVLCLLQMEDRIWL